MLADLKHRVWLKVLGRQPEPELGEFHSHVALVERIGDLSRLMRGKYLDFPAFVHLETLAVCNAACDFCPYADLQRKGTKMPDALIQKIIGDLAEGPRDVPFLVAPYKVSDPFLEPRLYDIIELVAHRLPNARIALITNGSPLARKNIERLATCRNIAYLNVSLNFADRAEYERVMGMPFERTLSRLDELHRRAAQAAFAFPIRLTRVSGGREADLAFLDFTKRRYPRFPALIVPRNDWLGEVITAGANTRVPDAPCHRWFDLSIIATGDVAFCCMDGEARYSKGNVARQHALEIYNQPHLRARREGLPSRRAAGNPCSRCTYLTG